METGLPPIGEMRAAAPKQLSPNDLIASALQLDDIESVSCRAGAEPGTFEAYVREYHTLTEYKGYGDTSTGAIVQALKVLRADKANCAKNCLAQARSLSDTCFSIELMLAPLEIEWPERELPAPEIKAPLGAVSGWISLKDGETPGLGTPVEWRNHQFTHRGTMTAMRDNGVTRSFRFLTFSDDPRPGDYDFTASDSDFWRPIPLAGS